MPVTSSLKRPAAGPITSIRPSVMSWVTTSKTRRWQPAPTTLNLTGNAGDNMLKGNAGDNLLDGGGGNNYLDGGGGNDTFIIRSGGDHASYGDGALIESYVGYNAYQYGPFSPRQSDAAGDGRQLRLWHPCGQRHHRQRRQQPDRRLRRRGHAAGRARQRYLCRLPPADHHHRGRRRRYRHDKCQLQLYAR